jgi:hypothetical protein
MQNVRTVRHQQFEDIIYVRNTTQQKQSMHTPVSLGMESALSLNPPMEFLP